MNRIDLRTSAMTCALYLGALCLGVAGMATAFGAGLASSASKVDVTATFKPATETHEPRIRVRLDIADGWHVNAHPASLDFLVSTTIDARAEGETLPLKIAWPEGHNSGIELGGTSIKVYGDNTIIPVKLASTAARTAGQLTLNVRVQACSNDGICLPPSTLNVQPTQS